MSILAILGGVAGRLILPFSPVLWVGAHFLFSGKMMSPLVICAGYRPINQSTDQQTEPWSINPSVSGTRVPVPC